MIESTLDAGGLRWRLLRAGSGPALLLLHGTGTSADTWRPLAPHLAGRYTLLAPDLPGHAGTSQAGPASLALPGMAAALLGLLSALGLTPVGLVGHSAGAALAVRLTLDGLPVRALAGIDPAIVLPANPRALPGWSFVSWLAQRPAAATLGAALLRDRARFDLLVGRALGALPEEQRRRYHTLAADPAHVAATLGMMANWDVAPVRRDLARLRVPACFLAGERDPWFPPPLVERLAAECLDARAVTIPGTAHFSHEEAPAAVAAELLALVGG